VFHLAVGKDANVFLALPGLKFLVLIFFHGESTFFFVLNVMKAPRDASTILFFVWIIAKCEKNRLASISHQFFENRKAGNIYFVLKLVEEASKL